MDILVNLCVVKQGNTWFMKTKMETSNITQVSKTELRMPNPFLPDMEFVAKDQ